MFKLSRRVKYSYEALRIKSNKFRGGGGESGGQLFGGNNSSWKGQEIH